MYKWPVKWKWACSLVCVCVYMLVKVYQINGSIVGQSKEDKNVVFTYIHGYVCVSVCEWWTVSMGLCFHYIRTVCFLEILATRFRIDKRKPHAFPFESYGVVLCCSFHDLVVKSLFGSRRNLLLAVEEMNWMTEWPGWLNSSLFILLGHLRWIKKEFYCGS